VQPSAPGARVCQPSVGSGVRSPLQPAPNVIHRQQ
jgi:hypothetical protein